MSDKCPECDKWASKGATFCAACGRNTKENGPEPKHTFIYILTLVAVITVTAIVLINTVYCIANFDAIAEESGVYIFAAYLDFGLWDVTLFTYGETGIRAYLALLIAVGILTVAFALYRFLPTLRKEPDSGAEEPIEKTGLSAASLCLCVLLFLSVAYFLVMGAFGHTADASWLNQYTDNQKVFLLTRAGLREELTMRVVWIGIPMMAVALLLRKDKRCWQYLFGGFGLSKVAFVLIVVSSVAFGLAHNNGWGWVKILNAAFAGIIFGYLYTEYGLYASVLAHTANDVLTTVALTPLGTTNMVLMELALLVIGFVILVHWILKPRWDLIRADKMETFPGKLECNLLEQWKHH